MKKGFTLIEMITVIILLGVIALIAFPTVNSMIKQSKEKLYNNQIEKIKTASEKWAYDNISLLPNQDGDSVTITLLDLKKGGYLPLDIRNPKTNELFSNGTSIVITYEENDYVYSLEGSISNLEYNENSPSIILNGGPIEIIEVNEEYIEKNAIAESSTGDSLENIIITYYDNGREIARIDTTELKTYTVEYSITDSNNNLTTAITRTVIVNDSIAPIIELPERVNISLSEAASYDLMNGVLISDNSNKRPNIEITGYDSSIGEKIVSYKACDNSNNCTTKNRIIGIN